MSTEQLPEGDDGGARVVARAWSDRELVLAMRRDEPRAFTEFVARFRPLLLHRAALLRVWPGEREELVVDVLDDAATRLADPAHRPPRYLAAYLVRALHHRVLNRRRAGARRRVVAERAAREMETHAERAVLTVCSESALRASHGPDWAAPPINPALARLAAALERRLTEDERRLIGWLGAHVPQRHIAAWLGISYGAVSKRIARLRARMRGAADAYIAAQGEPERAALRRFFERLAPEDSNHA